MTGGVGGASVFCGYVFSGTSAFVSWSMVIYGPLILLFKWLGFWVVVLVVLIIVGVFWLYSVLFEKKR